MIHHIIDPRVGKGQFCGSSTGGDKWITVEEIYSTPIDELCENCLPLVEAYWSSLNPLEKGERILTMFTGEKIEKVVNEAEKPNKYSILQSDQGRWQILEKTEGAGYWIVKVKDCGSMRFATLMLNAIITGAKPGTREYEILNASSK